MISLEDYGWNSHFQSLHYQHPAGAVPGRVVSITGFRHHVITSTGECEAELAGRLLFGAQPEDLPKVGDWVSLLPYETQGYIVEVLPRMNALSRKSPGARFESQILVTNLDAAFVVQGLDRDFNLMRLERYLVQLAACNVPAVVLLNKADLVPDTEIFVAEVRKLAREVPVYACSTKTGHGLSTLAREVWRPRKTYVLVGSSGVGKSTLLNALMGSNAQPIGGLSDVTEKGKHTTTARSLFALPNGSLLIDTPGMRELGVTAETGDEPENVFPAIAALAESCRYKDCTHQNEAHCAVLEALAGGTLDAVVYDSYIKLVKEQRRFLVKAEDKKRMEKQFGKLAREAGSHRRKYEY